MSHISARVILLPDTLHFSERVSSPPWVSVFLPVLWSFSEVLPALLCPDCQSPLETETLPHPRLAGGEFAD